MAPRKGNTCDHVPPLAVAREGGGIALSTQSFARMAQAGAGFRREPKWLSLPLSLI